MGSACMFCSFAENASIHLPQALNQIFNKSLRGSELTRFYIAKFEIQNMTCAPQLRLDIGQMRSWMRDVPYRQHVHTLYWMRQMGERSERWVFFGGEKKKYRSADQQLQNSQYPPPIRWYTEARINKNGVIIDGPIFGTAHSPPPFSTRAHAARQHLPSFILNERR